MKISKIIEKNLCYDSRKLKKNDIFFDFISNKKKNNPYLKKIVEKKTLFDNFTKKSKL